MATRRSRGVKSAPTLFTVGYEGTEIEDFTAFLRRKKIRILADLRKNPVSRKRGFSKSRLAEHLQSQRIEYLHFPNLGMPTAWRKAAKEERITRKKMFSEYEKKVLPRPESEKDMLHLLTLIKSGLAILCYEADPSDCHRSQVARRMQSLSPKPLIIENLSPRERVALRHLSAF